MQRAAQRARQIAAQTGTAVVVMRDGVLEHVYPQAGQAGTMPGAAPRKGNRHDRLRPKIYQQQVLDSVEAYFKACHEVAFALHRLHCHHRTAVGLGNPYHPLSGFPADMPYFCLRVPTGGGKTWLAAKSVSLVNTHLLRASTASSCGWCPASRSASRPQGPARPHPPYHLALREAGPITVMDLEEAKSVTRATLDTSTTVIVATRQAFQVEDEECRKVYQSSGALMHHFDNLSPAQRDELLSTARGEQRTTPYSLANVLRLRRPFVVVVDEAHNSRTELAFDMLARFRPSGVMELTATPTWSARPATLPYSVSAAEPRPRR